MDAATDLANVLADLDELATWAEARLNADDGRYDRQYIVEHLIDALFALVDGGRQPRRPF